MKRLIGLTALILISMMVMLTGCPATEAEVGPTGPTGPQGEQGSAGPQGEQGPDGPQGEPGILATTGEIATTVPGAGIQSPGSKTIEVNHGLEGLEEPPFISVGLVTDYGIIIDDDFIFGFQYFLETTISGADNIPKIAFAIFDITTESFKLAIMCTEDSSTQITLRWWAMPAIAAD